MPRNSQCLDFNIFWKGQPDKAQADNLQIAFSNMETIILL